MHIVGLGFDANDAAMSQGLYDTRGGRGKRAQKMSEGLAKVGIHGAYEGALRFVGNPELISRTHFARFLVEQGHCRDTPEVFRKFLTEGKPGYVPHRWASLKDAVHWITAAKGMAVIAHPGRTASSRPTRSTRCSSNSRRMTARRSRSSPAATRRPSMSSTPTRRSNSISPPSRGSDFHSPDESHCDLGGKLPPLHGALLLCRNCSGDRIQQ